MSPPIILGAQSVYGGKNKNKKTAGWPESHWGSFPSASIIGQWALCQGCGDRSLHVLVSGAHWALAAALGTAQGYEVP